MLCLLPLQTYIVIFMLICVAFAFFLLLIFLNKQFHMVEATYRVKEARKQLYSENGRYPDDKEVAEATGLSMKRLTAVLLTPKAPRSLEQKIGINQNLKPSVCPIPIPLHHWGCNFSFKF